MRVLNHGACWSGVIRVVVYRCAACRCSDELSMATHRSPKRVKCGSPARVGQQIQYSHRIYIERCNLNFSSFVRHVPVVDLIWTITWVTSTNNECQCSLSAPCSVTEKSTAREDGSSFLFASIDLRFSVCIRAGSESWLFGLLALIVVVDGQFSSTGPYRIRHDGIGRFASPTLP